MPEVPLPDWSDAACLGCDTDLWFSDDETEITMAKAVCSECPIRQTCLDYAMANGETEGIWGGLLPIERQRTKRRRWAEARRKRAEEEARHDDAWGIA